MSKIIVINTIKTPYNEGDIINYDGVIHTIKKIEPVLVMNQNVMTSVLIEPVNVKSFKSNEVVTTFNVSNPQN